MSEITEIRKGRRIIAKARILKTKFELFSGLRFKRKLKENEGLLFVFDKEVKSLIDMFFVFFPIDVLFIDKDKEVIEMKENFRPFSFYAPQKKSMYVVELPADAIRKNSIEIGDELAF